MSSLKLVIGNKNYSGWSMRSWMLLRWLDLEFEEIRVPLYGPESRQRILAYSPSGKLPVLIDDGNPVWESFAILIYLAERFTVWPADPAKRAFALSICAEMHTGFAAVRAELPFNARGFGRQVVPTAHARKDISRIEQIWIEGRHRYQGDWLAGEFGPADIAFAPVACRFRTYAVHLDPIAACYCSSLLAHPLVRQWTEAAESEVEMIPAEEIGFATDLSFEGPDA